MGAASPISTRRSSADLKRSEPKRTQRYAGDASLYGTTELRVPLAKFPFILPLDVGAIGFYDAGKVYVNGDRRVAGTPQRAEDSGSDI